MGDAPISLTLTLDPALYRAAATCAQQCGFAGVAELVAYLLRGVTEEPAADAADAELELIQDRLRDLGYIE